MITRDHILKYLEPYEFIQSMINDGHLFPWYCCHCQDTHQPFHTPATGSSLKIQKVIRDSEKIIWKECCPHCQQCCTPWAETYTLHPDADAVHKRQNDPQISKKNQQISNAVISKEPLPILTEAKILLIPAIILNPKPEHSRYEYQPWNRIHRHPYSRTGPETLFSGHWKGRYKIPDLPLILLILDHYRNAYRDDHH